MSEVVFSIVKKVTKRFGGRGLGRIRPLKAVYDSVFMAFQPKIVNVQGHKMYLDPRDRSISRELIINGVYEPFETRFIKSRIKPRMRVVDLGANVGYYTLIMAKLVGPKGRVYAFEPNPENFALLKKNVEANGYGNVSLANFAVSDKAKKEKLFLSEDNLGGHHLTNRGDYKKFTTVQTVVLDKFFSNEGMKIDFVKMDIEGSEPRAMKGMKKILRSNPRMQLITENGSKSKSYFDFLLNNFQMFRLDEKEKKIFRFTNEDISKAIATPAIPGYQNFYCKR